MSASEKVRKWLYGEAYELSLDRELSAYQDLSRSILSGEVFGMASDKKREIALSVFEQHKKLLGKLWIENQTSDTRFSHDKIDGIFALKDRLIESEPYKSLVRSLKDANTQTGVFNHIGNFIDQPPCGNAEIEALESELRAAIRNIETGGEAPTTSLCDQPSSSPACTAKLPLYSRLSGDDIMRKAVELLDARGKLAISGGFSNFAELRLSRRESPDPGRWRSWLDQETVKLLKAMESDHDGSKCAEPNAPCREHDDTKTYGTSSVLEALLRAFGMFLGIVFEKVDDMPTWDKNAVAYRVKYGDARETIDAGMIVFDLVRRPGKTGTYTETFRHWRGTSSDAVRVVSSVHQERTPDLHRLIASIAHETGHCVESLLKKDSGSIWIDIAPPHLAELSSVFFMHVAFQPSFIRAFTEHYERITGDSLDIGELVKASRYEALSVSYRYAISGLEDIAVHSIPYGLITAGKIREEVEKARNNIEGVFCPGSWTRPLLILDRTYFAGNVHCYFLGSAVSSKILPYERLSENASDLERIGTKYMNALRLSEGPFNLAKGMGIELDLI